MSRAQIPSNFSKKIELLKTIKAKVDLDGGASPLLEMMAKKSIDLDADTVKGAAAVVFDNDFRLLSKTSQNQKQQVDAAMKIVIKDTTGSYQNLKSLCEPNFKEVGDWGAVITDGGKFTYPVTYEGWMDWFTLLKAKNDSYVSPAVSPLLSYVTTTGVSLTIDATNGAAALVKQALQVANKSASEKARQDRDNKFNPVMIDLRAIVKFLMTLYPGNVKQLGLYGITVVLTPKVIKTRNKVIKASTSSLNVRVAIGSTVVNTGTIPMPIYKGATISGTPVMLAVGVTYTITKGYGQISFHNPTTDTSGMVKLIPKKLSV